MKSLDLDQASTGATPTDYLCTGQRLEAEIGLYFYNARFYDAKLGRFAQADTIIPGAGNVLALDRYAYVQNNPLRYTDPSGHDRDCHVGEIGCNQGIHASPPPPRPKIVPREEWGALSPQSNILLGRNEGFYDSASNTAGYASYSELYPDRLLAEILDSAVIHHEGNFQTYSVETVQASHMIRNGWTDIGYHYVISPDGTIYEGRDIEARGSHVEGENTGRVGILLLGDFEPGPEFSIEFGIFGRNHTLTISDIDDLGPTDAQVTSSLALLRWLDYVFGVDQVLGHNDLNDTQCPGSYCIQYIKEFNDVVQEY